MAPPRSTDRVHLYPRRKAGDDAVPVKGRQPVELTREAISAMFVMPQPDAARDLGVSLTALKQVCRRLGITRWPYMRPSKKGRRYRRRSPEELPEVEADSACADHDVHTALEATVVVTPRSDDDETEPTARSAFLDSAANAAYQSDSGDSCYSADTEVARTSSTASDAEPLSLSSRRSSSSASFAVEFEESVEAPAAVSDEAPTTCDAHPALARADDFGDALGWLVSCEADSAGASFSDVEHGPLEQTWRCLQSCCQRDGWIIE